MASRNALTTFLALSIVAAAAACGCSRSAPTRLYVLQPLAEAPAGQVLDGPVVVVGPVTVPVYLDVPGLVAAETYRADLAENDRWGEPLQAGVGRVVAQNVAGQLPGHRVHGASAGHQGGTGYRVVLDVEKFDRLPDGQAVLSVIWTVSDLGSHEELGSQRSVIREPVTGAGYAAYCAAQSRNLQELSRHIAGAIHSLE